MCAVGEEEVEIGGEETIDEKALTKRDIHTLNEQRRRDIIKVHVHVYTHICIIHVYTHH